MPRKEPAPLFPEFESDSGPSLYLEKRYMEMGFDLVAGVDEAGRGPLAGPVVAAAVVIPRRVDKKDPLWKARDSKALSFEQRHELYRIIVDRADACSWAICDHTEIDKMNILAASLEAMRRAIMEMDPRPHLCLVDGDKMIPCRTPSVPVVKGDARCLSIAAASILAKVIRDQIMNGFHRMYPDYGFMGNKGYATTKHKKVIIEQGPCPVHRRTFRGVKEYI